MNMTRQSQNPWFDARNFFRQKSMLSYLVLINIAVWILLQIIRVLAFLFENTETASAFSAVIDYLAVPASLPLLLHRPWTLLTYMFLHVSIWHILFNMLWLFWFGRIFLEYLTEKQLLLVYMLGGLAGAFAYIFAYNVFPVFAPMLGRSYALGASASVMAIVTAIAFYVPNYSLYLLFFGRVKIIYIAIVLFILDFFTIPGGNAGGQIAHIGGALLGFLYIKTLRPSSISGFSSKVSISSWFTRMFTVSKKGRDKKRTARRPMTDDEFNYQKNQQQKRIDMILDKISKGGYDSLTREEKEFLFKSSGKH
ncbi:MAG: rhomboid family intramembrane serine protease [Bacteroidetes bacterium]|nr:MAG: rhomboid family intramembrane serine protease [Bacteroidota bacterium]